MLVPGLGSVLTSSPVKGVLLWWFMMLGSFSGKTRYVATAVWLSIRIQEGIFSALIWSYWIISSLLWVIHALLPSPLVPVDRVVLIKLVWLILGHNWHIWYNNIFRHEVYILIISHVIQNFFVLFNLWTLYLGVRSSPYILIFTRTYWTVSGGFSISSSVISDAPHIFSLVLEVRSNVSSLDRMGL